MRSDRINSHLSGLKGVALLIVFLFAFLFTSCKKEAVKSTNPVSATPIDTGSSVIGATRVGAMSSGTTISPSFIPAQSISLSNVRDTVISGLALNGITLFSCANVTIKNCKIGPSSTFGIVMHLCTNIKIDSCYIYQVSTGIFVADSQTISITNCQCKNMLGPFPEGQFIQFQNVSGSGNRISFNKFENVLGESNCEDAISLFKSNGSSSDPILVESNWIRGGGPSLSGGGIMLGDGGGSYQVAKNNFLVDPGQYGMAVSGGSNMAIVNNTIYARSQSFTSEGLYYQNYYLPIPSSNITIAKNAVNFTNSGGQLNNIYLAPNNAAPWGWNSNANDTALSELLLPEPIVTPGLFPN